MKNIFQIKFSPTLSILIFSMIFLNFFSFLTSNLIDLWFLLEINLMMFIFISIMFKEDISSIIIYFLIQSISSLLILWILINKNELQIQIYLQFLLFFLLSIKFGLMPFIFLPPMIFHNFNWWTLLIFLTLQKFIPFLMLNKLVNQLFTSMFFLKILLINCIITMFFSTIKGIYSTNFKKILIYSSINNSCWMIPLLIISKNYFIIYFIFYSFTNIFLIYLFHLINIENSFQSSFSFFPQKKNYLFLMIFFLFLMSMTPPMLTFLIKLNSIQLFIEFNFTFFSIILTITSAWSSMMYINMMFMMLFQLNFKFSYYQLSTKISLNYFFSILISFSILIIFFMKNILI